jgi:hypothetical protein
MVHQGYMLSVLKLVGSPLMRNVTLSIEMLGHDSLITRARNTLLGRFMARADATHILFIDADIGFEPEQVDRMLRAGLPLVAGTYPLKVLHWDDAVPGRMRQGEALASAALLYVGEACQGEEAERAGDFVTAVSAGTGFMLIRREVIAAMAAAYPETRYRQVDAYAPGSAREQDQHALFDCVIAPESGTYLSEDFTFCRRWRAIGGKVWLDTVGRLTHTGMHDFAGNPAWRFLPGGLLRQADAA